MNLVNFTLSDCENVAAFADKLIVKTSLVVEYLCHIEVKAFKRRAEVAKEKPELQRKRNMKFTTG